MDLASEVDLREEVDQEHQWNSDQVDFADESTLQARVAREAVRTALFLSFDQDIMLLSFLDGICLEWYWVAG